MNMCSTLSACTVLTELRDRDGDKAFTSYAGLPSTSEETKVLAPFMPLDVSHFKPALAADIG